MSQVEANDALNRVLALLCRSFPMYLRDAPPFIANGDQRAIAAIDQIVADQTLLSGRIGRFIMSNSGRLETGEFPMEFTDAHDLSVDYILRLAITYQKQDITAIEQMVDEVRLNPAAANLAEEALGMAKGHLQSLEELANPQPAKL